MGKEISAEEQLRRQGSASARHRQDSQKSVSAMTEDEKLDFWSRTEEIADPSERVKRMGELAENGYTVSYVSLANAYMDLGMQTGNVQWNEIMCWLKKAAEAGIPSGYLFLGQVYRNKKNPEYDLWESLDAFCVAAGMGQELACKTLVEFWNCMDEESVPIFREDIINNLKPVVTRLQEENTILSNNVQGLLYYYGVYYEQDFAQAKHFFTQGKKLGSSLGIRMCSNPIFEDDEDEDD